jgi:hypothetical protein
MLLKMEGSGVRLYKYYCPCIGGINGMRLHFSLYSPIEKEAYEKCIVPRIQLLERVIKSL